MTGVGTQRDFSELWTKAGWTKYPLTFALQSKATWNEEDSPRPSSRYITIWMPLRLQLETTGIKSLVNIYGAEEGQREGLENKNI